MWGGLDYPSTFYPSQHLHSATFVNDREGVFLMTDMPIESSVFYQFFVNHDLALSEEAVQLLGEVGQWMQDNPDHFDMNMFFGNDFSCGTSLCIAGTALYLRLEHLREFDLKNSDSAIPMYNSLGDGGVAIPIANLLMNGNTYAAHDCDLFFHWEWDDDLNALYKENRLQAGLAAIDRFIAASFAYARNRSEVSE